MNQSYLQNKILRFYNVAIFITNIVMVFGLSILSFGLIGEETKLISVGTIILLGGLGFSLVFRGNKKKTIEVIRKN